MKDNLPRYTFRTNRVLLDKLKYVAKYHGRSINGELEVLARTHVEAFEKKHGKIEAGAQVDEL